jgi:hypothetical protein
LLADDIEIRHDSGGKVPAAIHVLRGKAPVVEFLEKVLQRVWKKYRWVVTDLNGARGVVLEKEGAIVTASDLDRLQRGRGGYTDLHPSESRQTRESLQRRRHLRARTARMTTKESANE